MNRTKKYESSANVKTKLMPINHEESKRKLIEVMLKQNDSSKINNTNK